MIKDSTIQKYREQKLVYEVFEPQSIPKFNQNIIELITELKLLVVQI